MLLNTILIQELRGVNFWLVVTVKWGVGLRQRILIEHSLVGFNHLFHVMLRGDAKVIAIILAKSHTEMVINWPSTFQFEPILLSKHICNCLGVLTRDAEVIYIEIFKCTHIGCQPDAFKCPVQPYRVQNPSP
jgi:hypothetical protein